VEVAGRDGNSYLLSARHAVVVATGSRPNVPPIGGLADLKFWTTREATSAREVPGRLAVLGGGVAGTELAQAYSRLGAAVTVVARHGLLGMFPAEAADLVAAGLRADGVKLYLHTGTQSVRGDADGTFTLTLDGGSTVTADKLLVATGRHPALEGIGLESVGLAAEDGKPLRLRTDSTGLVAGAAGNDAGTAGGGGPWLYATGDAAGKVMLTHQGKYEARATGDAIAARAKGGLAGEPAPWSRYAQTADEHAIPNVVFTDPELANVGRTVAQAEKDGYKVSSVELPIQVAGSSLHAEHYEGWAQLVIDEERKVLLGATFAGPDVSELLHAATIAVVGEVPLDRLWHAVPSYPTISEVWLRLLEDYGL
jgi:dihydrolipoamide dehydrogenase